MGRTEIYNIDKLVEKGPGRVAYIRPTQDKIFQTASIIVMKKSYPDGYILKKDFKTTDEDGSLIKITVPKQTEHLNLGLVELERKYDSQIKICDKKMKDLKDIGKDLDKGGLWIFDLEREQTNDAKVYPKDKDETIFPEETVGYDNTFEDYEVPEQVDSNQEK